MTIKLTANDNAKIFNLAVYGVLLVVFALILPVVILPIVKLFGYSEIIEEIARTIMVFFLILKLPSQKAQIVGAVVFGLLFGVSENMFYLNNFFQLGNFAVFWQRFLWTVPMHVIATLVILFSCLAGRKWIALGFVEAAILHLMFNSFTIRFF
ncbi:MAG: hypothetical protein V1928_00070 [Parcubacteria group bacterium]